MLVRVTEWRGLPHESRLLRHCPPPEIKLKQASGGPPCDLSQSSHLNSATRVKNPQCESFDSIVCVCKLHLNRVFGSFHGCWRG